MIALRRLAVVNAHDREDSLSLILDADRNPISLGEGRYAHVFLGTKAAPGENTTLEPGQLVAMKFLKLDKSVSVRTNASYRFYREVDAMARLERMNPAVVVNFFGYGRLSTLPLQGSTEMELIGQALGLPRDELTEGVDATGVLSNLTRRELDGIFSNNPTSEPWAVGLTGDFYALQLCAMSMDDLLLHRGDAWANAVGKAFARTGIATSPISKLRDTGTEELRKFGVRLHEKGNGFDDMHSIQAAITEKFGKNRFSAAASFALALRCLKAVEQLHTSEYAQGARGLCHRDLKPGNVLLSLEDPTEFVLSDLGFVASVPEILNGAFTKAASLDEGGVLPTGSRGFRAPEQIESGEELSILRIDPIPPNGPVSLEVVSQFDTEVTTGDWLQWDDRTTNTRHTHRAFDPRDENGGRVCSVGAPPGTVVPQTLIRARLIKDVAMHSDVYACGCLAYYFGSEGKDPERFMRVFVDGTGRLVLNSVLESWVTESPHFLAAVLCLDESERIAADLRTLETNGQWSKEERKRCETIVTSLGDFTFGRNMTVIRQIAKFRSTLRKTPAHNALLRNRRDNPITFPQLLLTLLCCMRDTAGCVVARDPDLYANQRFAAVYSAKAEGFAAQILRLVTLFKAGSKSLAFEPGNLAYLGTEAHEILIRARLADRSRLVRTGARATPVAGTMNTSSPSVRADAKT